MALWFFTNYTHIFYGLRFSLRYVKTAWKGVQSFKKLWKTIQIIFPLFRCRFWSTFWTPKISLLPQGNGQKRPKILVSKRNRKWLDILKCWKKCFYQNLGPPKFHFYLGKRPKSEFPKQIENSLTATNISDWCSRKSLKMEIDQNY